MLMFVPVNLQNSLYFQKFIFFSMSLFNTLHIFFKVVAVSRNFNLRNNLNVSISYYLKLQIFTLHFIHLFFRSLLFE
jgi:hypothetical protein